MERKFEIRSMEDLNLEDLEKEENAYTLSPKELNELYMDSDPTFDRRRESPQVCGNEYKQNFTIKSNKELPKELLDQINEIIISKVSQAIGNNLEHEEKEDEIKFTTFSSPFEQENNLFVQQNDDEEGREETPKERKTRPPSSRGVRGNTAPAQTINSNLSSSNKRVANEGFERNKSSDSTNKRVISQDNVG